MKNASRFMACLLAVSVFISGCAADRATPVDRRSASNLSLDEAEAVINSTVSIPGADKNTAYAKFTADRLWNLTTNIQTLRSTLYSCTYESMQHPEVITGVVLEGTNMPVVGVRAEPCFRWVFQISREGDAKKFAAALLRFRNSTLVERQAWLAGKEQAFTDAAARYRSANPKPAISEDVHRFDVVAQAAVREKRFVEAAKAYDQGLELAPWWPEGRFNAALLWGEAGYFSLAVDHMKKYLALVPNPPNLRAIKDKIYEWEAKMATSSEESRRSTSTY
jgi:tetratricopeptide (TPR) repeat protein